MLPCTVFIHVFSKYHLTKLYYYLPNNNACKLLSLCVIFIEVEVQPNDVIEVNFYINNQKYRKSTFLNISALQNIPKRFILNVDRLYTMSDTNFFTPYIELQGIG